MRVRFRAVAFIVTFPLLVVPTILWFGLPVLWRAYPREFRAAYKMIRTGKTGPYPGVVW